MFKAAWKSLLGRKLRLLMSTFAIVLGVAFVAGSLIFTDTLSRSFDAIFASSVGDVVVRPVGGTSADGTPTTKTMPAELVDELASVEGAARADGNVSSFSVFVVGDNGKVVGGQGAPGIGLNWNDAPAANGLEGLEITDGRVPEQAGEVVLDEGTAERAGYEVGDTIHVVTSSQDAALLRPELVGIAQFADGGSTNGATLTMFDTRDRAGALPRRRGRLQRRLGHRRRGEPGRSCATTWPRCCRTASRPSPATTRPTRRPAT